MVLFCPAFFILFYFIFLAYKSTGRFRYQLKEKHKYCLRRETINTLSRANSESREWLYKELSRYGKFTGKAVIKVVIISWWLASWGNQTLQDNAKRRKARTRLNANFFLSFCLSDRFFDIAWRIRYTRRLTRWSDGDVFTFSKTIVKEINLKKKMIKQGNLYL